MNKSVYKISKLETTKVLLAAVFVALIFIPLWNMFIRIDRNHLLEVTASPVFKTALKNSLLSTTLSTIITICLAMAASFSIERCEIRQKNLFKTLLTLPMLIPSISLGMGLVILFGNNGILTRMLQMESGIYGLLGLVMGSVLYSFPVAFIMISDIMKYEDGSSYEAAEVLGLSKVHQFKIITMPYMKKPMINVIFSIFTLIVTDYGVPLMVGGKFSTIPVVMYQEVIGQLNFGKGAVYGSVLLIPAVLAFLIDLKNQNKGNASYAAKKCKQSDSIISKIRAYTVCILCALYMLMPVVSFLMLGFTDNYPSDLSLSMKNIYKTFALKTGEYYLNSLFIALSVAATGIVIAFLTAYLSARTKSKISKFLHLSCMTSAAIPGVVLGLIYVLTFKGTIIYGTVIILIMVNLVHFISTPYLMMYNSLKKANENLEVVGQTMGISRWKMIRDVFVPTCSGTLLEMFSYFFVNCMMTISAVSFLADAFNKPVALMINQFEAQMQLECAAIVSLMILGTNVILKILLGLMKKKMSY